MIHGIVPCAAHAGGIVGVQFPALGFPIWDCFSDVIVMSHDYTLPFFQVFYL